MQLTETLNESLKREYTVSLPASDVQARIADRLEALKDQVRLPGFRPGKVPMSLMKKRYAKSVLGEVADALVKEALQDLTEHKGLRPATQPKLDVDGELSEDGPMEIKMSFEILPEIPDLDFTRISLEREVIEVEESSIDEALEDLRQYVETFEAVPEGQAAVDGNTVLIDFIGRIDGEAFENGSAEGHALKLGSGQFIPGFEDQLIGAKAGETRNVTVSFPSDYPAADLAGKEAVFEVKVNGVQEAVRPEMNDELAKKFGSESLSDLRTKMHERLTSDYAKIAFNRLKPRLLDALAPMVDFPVPESMLEMEFATIWQEIETAIKNDTLDEEDKGKSEEDLRKDYREIAIRRMRLGLLLAETGRKNNLNISQDELRQLLMAEMQRYPGQEKAVMDYYRTNQHAMEQLRAPLFEDKACQFILDKATVTDKTVTIAHIRAEVEEGETKTEAKSKAKKTKPKAAAGAEGEGTEEQAKPKSRAKKPKAEE